MKLKGTTDKRSETEITASILDGLQTLRMGSFNRINNAPVFDPIRKFYRKQGKHSPPGISDIIGVCRGRYACIEVKKASELRRVERFQLLLKETNADLYDYLLHTENKWEKHILQQIIFIKEKVDQGAIGFFTASLEHVIEQLKTLETVKKGLLELLRISA